MKKNLNNNTKLRKVTNNENKKRKANKNRLQLIHSSRIHQ